VPTSISAQARAIVALGLLTPQQPFPALDDPSGWRAMIAEREADVARMLASAPAAGDSPPIETRDVGGVTVYDVIPDGVRADDRRVYLELHGGGFIQGGGEICRARAPGAAALVGARTWAVDYRMPPGHPFPAPLEDCLSAYRGLLELRRPSEIVVGGASAGGNLVAALLLRARDEGLAMPAAAVLHTPLVDLTESGDSIQTNMGLDPLLTSNHAPALQLYAGGHDLREPYLSPLYGDLTGFPPTILTTGTRDLLLSDTVRMHRALRAAGVRADLHVFEAAGHGGFLGRAPEDQDRIAEVRRFIAEVLG
jgi:acetyl esterase/lipase